MYLNTFFDIKLLQKSSLCPYPLLSSFGDSNIFLNFRGVTDGLKLEYDVQPNSHGRCISPNGEISIKSRFPSAILKP